MSFPLYGIVAIAAGGGALFLGVLIVVIVVVHRRRKRRSRDALENLRMTLGTGSNVDLQEVQTYSPKKSRTASWTNNTHRRNKLQRSPTHARTLRQASSRDSIKPLIRHKKSRDGNSRTNVSIVEPSELQPIEPAAVYVPTGRRGDISLTPISEKDTPDSSCKTSYRGVSRTSNGFGWNFTSQPRSLPALNGSKHRSFSASASPIKSPSTSQVPKSILKQPNFHRSISLQSQSPGPVPEVELPPTPQISHALLPEPRRLFGPSVDYYQSFPQNQNQYVANHAVSSGQNILQPHAYYTPTTTAPFLRAMARNITPPEFERQEMDRLRSMDNSPAHSIKASMRPQLRTHDSYQASVERSSLIRDQSSSLSLSLQDNWLTPSKPNVSGSSDQLGEHPCEANLSAAQSTTSLAAFDRSRRPALQESTGNSVKQLIPSITSQSLRTGKHPRNVMSQEERRLGAVAPRSESHKRSSTHRIVVQQSRPHSLARSAVIDEDHELGSISGSAHYHQSSSQVLIAPIAAAILPPELRPPSVAEFNPAIENVPALYGLRQQLENDPDFQNPEPDYSPLMSICRDMMSDEPSSGDMASEHAVVNVLPLEPQKREPRPLPIPARHTALSSSPPGPSPKIDDFVFQRSANTSSNSSNSNHRSGYQPNTSSLRKDPGRRRNQNRSPLRHSFRPSDSPEPPPVLSMSRESIQKQNARMTTHIMALRRQNSDVSTVDAPYFRLSGNANAFGISKGGLGMDTLNQGVSLPSGKDPFTDTRTKITVRGRQWHSGSGEVALPTTPTPSLEPVRARTDSERGLSPTARRIMAEKRHEQYERRRSRDSMTRSVFGAIGEERKAKKAKQGKGKMDDSNIAGLSPGSMLTAAGAF